MKKKILLLCLSLMAAISFAACDLFAPQESGSLDSQNQSSETGSVDTGSDTESGDSSEAEAHVYVSHEAVEATCQAAGNEAYYTCEDCDKIFNAEKVEIQEIPVIAQLDHSYVLQNEVPGTCSTVGVLAHYTCDGCDTLFDLTKNEITSAAGELDEANHSADEVLVATAQPNKLTYTIGEQFDPTGMIVAYKCANCEGEVIDNQFLTYEYQTAGATAFANGDTKLIVKFDKLSFELAITVTKIQAEITNVEETYATTCGVAPTISALSNVPDAPIDVKYYEGDTEVTADQFAAGKSYTVKLSIASTDSINGTEKTANITVEHAYAWVDDASDWKKLNYVCKCGDAADFYAMNYQSPYVDANNLGVDLSAFVIGAQDVQIKSVKQIIRMKDGNYVAAKDGEVVDIAYTNEGSVYSFAADKYEQPSGDWKPYILTLSVVYAIGEVECPIVVEVKFIDKLIKTAEDLLSVRYMGDPGDSGAAAMYGYYVLADNIDASGVEITGTNPCWQAASGFRGTFEGNGYTISNLTVVGGQGLFGAIGDGAKIQNVTFDNVKVNAELYALTYAARNATFTNVSVNFSVDSASYLVACTMNNCTFNNVNILTDKNAVAPFMVDENADEAIPATVKVSYFTQYEVTFNTDGGNEIAPVTVTAGKTVAQPIPEKYSDDFDYVFLGWYDGEMEWDFNAPITKDLTLKAKWEAVEKTNVLLDASKKTLTKWDYGSEITAVADTDAYYGNLWKITLGDGYEQSFQHEAISTKSYVKVYFYVYNPLAVATRLTIHGGYGEGWNLLTMDLAAGWTKVELDASAFAKADAGKIYLVIQEKSAAALAGEWKITSFYGLLEGETAPEVQAPVTPEEPETNVLLDASKKTLTKWDYGSEITAVADTDDEYGNVWKIVLGDGYEQSFQHDAIDTTGVEKVYFYVYNPLAVDVRLVVHGGWSAWQRATVMLSAQGWTKVELDVSVFNDDTAGKIFMVLQEVNAGSLAGEWKISSFYKA